MSKRVASKTTTATPTSERRRVLVGGVIGVAVAMVVAQFALWQLAVVSGWIIGALAVLLWTWIPILGLDANTTKVLSTREDNSRAAARGLLVGSATASLIGVMAALSAASHTQSQTIEVLLTVGSVLTVVVSWLTIQTVFALRYAHRYYLDPTGGISFPGDHRPDYHDFAYVSFTIGMTFQVSDTQIEAPAIRRLVLQQALLAYLFGVVIIAIVINIVAGFAA